MSSYDNLSLADLKFSLNLPYYLAGASEKEAAMADELCALLTEFEFLVHKVSALGPEPLIEDYDRAFIPKLVAFEDAENLRLIQGALRMSAHILTKDSSQIATQLWGRLMTQKALKVQALLKQIENEKQEPWLRPLTPSLKAPSGPEIYTLSSHSKLISAVAVTPDGKKVVSSSYDHTLKVWDLENGLEILTLGNAVADSGVIWRVSDPDDDTLNGSNDLTNDQGQEREKEVHTFFGHKDGVSDVTVTPDSKWAISGSHDHTLKIWDIESGTEMHTLSSHCDWISAVALTPDGKRAVSGSHDHTLKIWDLESGTEIRTLSGHSKWVGAVAVTPDGEWVISGSYDHTLKIWNLESGTEIRTLCGHGDSISDLVVTPDGKCVVSSSGDRTVKIWDLENGAEISTLEHGNFVHAVAVTPDGKQVVSGSSDRTLKVWDIKNGTEIRTLSGHSNSVLAVAVTPDGKRVVSGSWDKTLKVWDLEAGIEIPTLSCHSSPVRSIVVTPDGRQAVSCSHDQALKVWNLEGGTEVCSLKSQSSLCNTQAPCFAFNEPNLRGYDLRGINLPELSPHNINAVALTPNGNIAVTGLFDGTLKLWELEKRAELNTFVFHNLPIKSVGVSSNGRWLVSCSDDQTLTVADLENQTLRTFSGHQAGVNALAVSPDSELVISGSLDCTLKVWDLVSGDVMLTLSGHSKSVDAVAVASISKLVFSGSYDCTVKVWNLESGEEIHTFYGHSENVTSVAVMPNDKWVVSTSYDGTLKVWNWQQGKVIANFCWDSPLLACAVSPDGETIVFGDHSGGVHFLRLEMR